MKLYYSISEIGNILGVEPHTIRYWEREFGINPKRKNKRRAYKQENINDLLLIKELLYDKNYTIKGAKKIFKQTRKMANIDLNQALLTIRKEIAEIVKILE